MATMPKLLAALKKLSPSKGCAGRATPIMTAEVAPWGTSFQCFPAEDDDDASVETEEYYGSEEDFRIDEDSSEDEMCPDETGNKAYDSASSAVPELKEAQKQIIRP
jgi:hypothetical protein